MEGNIRVPRRLKRYFSSMCLVSVFLMVLVGPGAIITVLGQTMSFFNITNLLGSVGSLIESLAGFGKGGSCTFKCPDGSKPRPNPVHASTTDGCGAFGFQIHSQLFPAVTTCCETHDFCYDMCNSNKSVCDSQFQDCLKMICKNIHKATGGTELYEGCVSIAALAYKTTVAVGCKTFQQSQSNACICGGDPTPEDVHGDSGCNSGGGGGGSCSDEGGGGSGGGGSSSGEGGGGVGGGGGGESSSSQFVRSSKKTFGTKSRPSGDTASPPGSKSSSDETLKHASSSSSSSSSQLPPDQRDNGDGAFVSKTAKGGTGYTRHETDGKGHKVYNHADIVRANMPPGSPSSPSSSSSSSQGEYSTRDDVTGSKDDIKQKRRDKTKGSKNNLRRGRDDDDNDDDDNDDDDDDKFRSNVGGKKGYGKKHKAKRARQKDEF